MKLLKPRIQPVQKNELTSEQRELLDQLGQSGRLNVFRTLIRYPKLFQRFLVFGRYVLEESTLPSRDRELLILRIIKGPNAKGWSSFDAALLRAVDELHEDMFISDSTWDALAKRYTEQQLVDLVFTVGMYSLVSMVLNSIGVQLDEGVAGFPKQDSARVD